VAVARSIDLSGPGLTALGFDGVYSLSPNSAHVYALGWAVAFWSLSFRGQIAR
jgi:hypothetical protein